MQVGQFCQTLTENQRDGSILQNVIVQEWNYSEKKNKPSMRFWDTTQNM